MQSSFSFELDGEPVLVSGEPVHRTLASFLDDLGKGRDRRFHAPDPWQGGAPALLLDADAHSRPVLRSVDSGLLLLPALAGRRLWTAEGLARASDRGHPHPAVALLDTHRDLTTNWPARAQVLTALVEAWHRADLVSSSQLTEHFDACLSRQVSYPGLRDLGLSVVTEAARDPAVRHEAFPALKEETVAGPEEISYVDAGKRRFYRPLTQADLAKLLVQFPKATLVGGSTGLSWGEWTPGPGGGCLISLEGVAELRRVFEQEDRWLIGAAAPLTAVVEALGGSFPPLAKAARRVATRPIRNRSTLGGCLASARPDDPLAPVLFALDAVVRTTSLDGERDIPVARFFEGNGRTNLRPGEFISQILLPRFTTEKLKTRGGVIRICDGYLAAPRRAHSPGGLSAGFAVEMDADSRVTQAILAYSGVADRPVRAREVEKALVGRTWSEETVLSLLSRLNQEIESASSPAGRAALAALSANEQEYRRQLVITLLQKFFYQYPIPGRPARDLGVIGEWLSPFS